MMGNSFAQSAFQTLFNTIYPPQCVCCGAVVMQRGALCPDCWREAHFITGVICDSCGTPLVGPNTGDVEICDDCMTTARPWDKGRAVFLYKGTGRRLVLGLKHADRTEVSPVAARWIRAVCSDVITPDTLIAPIPLHWTRFAKRRYNQSALLGADLARITGLQYVPDLLIRHRRTKSLDGKTKSQRFEILDNAMKINKKFAQKIAGRDILLVDDVMTTGATFASAADLCRRAGVNSIAIVALARVAKDA